MASEFLGFLENFYTVFTEYNQTNFYITGESYAGRYGPYIADAIHNVTARVSSARNITPVRGLMINDGSFGDILYQTEMTSNRFAKENKATMSLNVSYAAQLDRMSKELDYESYLDKYLVYPAYSARKPMPQFTGRGMTDRRSTWAFAGNGLLAVNPCLNWYRITGMSFSCTDVDITPDTQRCMSHARQPAATKQR